MNKLNQTADRCTSHFTPIAIRVTFSLVLLLAVPTRAEDQAWTNDEVIQKAKRAVVAIERVGRNDTVPGFFASPDGLVVTLAEELAGCRAVIVHTSSGEKITQNWLVAVDEIHDLAVIATGKKPPAYLPVPEKPAVAGEICAIIFPREIGQVKAADGKLLARREILDRTGSRFVDAWSFALSLNSAARTGSPVITHQGQVAGLFFSMQAPDTRTRQRMAFAHPETVIATVLANARKARQALPFPQPSGIKQDVAASSDPDFKNGIKLMEEGDHRGAIERFRTALSRHPKSAWIHEQLAGCLFDVGDMTGARTLLEEATQMFPERPVLRMSLGMIMGRQGDLNQMVSQFRAFTNEVPKYGQAWQGLGDAQLELGNKKEAAEAYRKWNQLEPENILCWHALSQTGTSEEASKATSTIIDLESMYFKLRYVAPHRD